MQVVSFREQQKRDRRSRIFEAAMVLFQNKGFQETTVLDIAREACVSRGTVFNYYPYKEAILIDYLAQRLVEIQGQNETMRSDLSPLEQLYLIFERLSEFVEVNHELVLPLSYELLNPDPVRSRLAYKALPLVAMLLQQLSRAKELGQIRADFSLERLARTLANTFFLTALQWAAYRQDRSISDELHKALKLALEGMVLR